jgi:hypothetical protein
VLVLSVDVDQKPAQQLQVLQRRGLAVDERTRAAVYTDHSPQRALRAVIEAALAKPIDRRVLVRAVELHADLCAVGAGAYGARVRAISER